MDECNENKHNCSADATCKNTRGSFKCKCNEGYQGDGVNCAGKLTSGDHTPQSLVSPDDKIVLCRIQDPPISNTFD